MTRNAKRALSLIFAVIMLSMTLFSLPASAYGNGGISVYNGSGTKLGTGDIWTNNKSESDSGKILYGEVDALTESRLVIKVGYTVVAGQQAADRDTTWTKKIVYDATVVSANISISDNVTPIDARGYFRIDKYISRVCKSYNFGSGVKACSDYSIGCLYLEGE